MPDPFPFPAHHSHPALYTLQPQPATRAAQLALWARLTTAYCAHQRIFRLDAARAAEWPLFDNAALGRRLGVDGVRAVLVRMVESGDAEWVTGSSSSGGIAGVTGVGAGLIGGSGGGGGSLADSATTTATTTTTTPTTREGKLGGGGGAGKEREVFVWWRALSAWAKLVEEWVDNAGLKNTVLTLYELTQGDAALGTEIHGMDPGALRRALDVLVKRGKAQVFGSEDSLGVKFF
ncbi:MAG: hypothetical protein M1825_003567 [Sarcosagium campestre]|nr:MAG: hypothetical protein M1825_003567 [Sarcosagium campestre]